MAQYFNYVTSIAEIPDEIGLNVIYVYLGKK